MNEPSKNLVSRRLTAGNVYTRAELRDILQTQDATINNGVFRPKGFASILIFVTEQKTPDRTPYEDRLVGDTLEWEGQSRGRTDKWIIGHQSQGEELLLFYRVRKDQFTGGGFRYQGPFAYESHLPGKLPTKFVLKRLQLQPRGILDTSARPGRAP